MVSSHVKRTPRQNRKLQPTHYNIKRWNKDNLKAKKEIGFHGLMSINFQTCTTVGQILPVKTVCMKISGLKYSWSIVSLSVKHAVNTVDDA